MKVFLLKDCHGSVLRAYVLADDLAPTCLENAYRAIQQEAANYNQVIEGISVDDLEGIPSLSPLPIKEQLAEVTMPDAALALRNAIRDANGDDPVLQPYRVDVRLATKKFYPGQKRRKARRK